jgi:hypothetical protein
LPLPPPAHHEAVEKALTVVDKKQDKILKQLAIPEPPIELPEWKLQDKEIPPENYFILRNGTPIKSLKELQEVLEYIDDSTFEHHVNEYRNDFANWVRDTLNNPSLAESIQKADDKPGIISALLKHKEKIIQQVAKEHDKLQVVVKKRQETLKKLTSVEDQITELKAELAQKTKELAGERKRQAQLIKDKLDAEVQRRLQGEKQALIAARKELAKAKEEYMSKVQGHAPKIQDMTVREERLAKQAKHVAEEKKTLVEAQERAEKILKDAETINTRFEQMKVMDLQIKKNLDAISRREIELSRHEETIRQRERKLTADLTKFQEDKEQLIKLKNEHEIREQAIKKMENEAKELAADAEAHAQQAIEAERQAKSSMLKETKQLESLKRKIDNVLAKALAEKKGAASEKKAAMSAVALRKELHDAIRNTQHEIINERKQMEQDSYHSYLQNELDTTPAGQPGASIERDLSFVNKKDLPIYQKVEECRQALERRDLDAARKLYNELRDEFQKVKVAPSERDIIYNSIRELYDDIHLAMLS